MSENLYNPGQKGRDVIISEFVVHQKVFAAIMLDLETSPMQFPEQHYLIVGQWGMGKTTMLLRLKFGIEDSASLQTTLIPVIITEEQYQISELANLWEYVCQYLADHDGFETVYEDIEQFAADPNFEEYAFDILDSALSREKKKIVLLIDSFGDLLTKLKISEVRRLREILQTKNNIRIIGGSTSYGEIFLGYDQPFYEFFKTYILEGLDKQATIGLMLKLGELHGKKERMDQVVRNIPGRIETLRILTGGVPRTIAILSRIFVEYEVGTVMESLCRVLDIVTPYYKYRMDALPVQQQKIIDVVARNLEPITVKELAAKTRLVSKTVSAQLNQLEKGQFVIKNSTSNKNKTYLIRQRFWNIWYVMRYGRKDEKEKIIRIVKFMEAWLSDENITKRIESIENKITKEQVDNGQSGLFSRLYIALTQRPVNNDFKQKAREMEVQEKWALNDKEWFYQSDTTASKQRYYEDLKTEMLGTEAWDLESPFLITLGYIVSSHATGDKATEISDETKWTSMAWATSVRQMLKSLSMLNSDSGHIIYEDHLLLLKQFLEMQMVINQMKELPLDELSISIYVTGFFVRKLISIGLYNAVSKVVGEVSIMANGERILFIEQWKPFYLAIKYFNLPDELAKQPSELVSAVLPLVKLLKAE